MFMRKIKSALGIVSPSEPYGAKAKYPDISRMKYWDHICDIQHRQTMKGLSNYGQILEDNTKMSDIERIEAIEEELIDALMYLEHLKEVIK